MHIDASPKKIIKAVTVDKTCIDFIDIYSCLKCGVWRLRFKTFLSSSLSNQIKIGFSINKQNIYTTFQIIDG